MSSSREIPDDRTDPWREVRGGLPAQDAHLAGMSEGRAEESQAGPPFCLDECDHWLGRLAIYYVAHPTIANLFHCCFDYMEPWDWSRETEHVETGLWVRLSSPVDD